MIRASVEVKDENSSFSIGVCAENLQRAVEFAANRFPGYAVNVRFPLDPEVFFVEGSTLESETAEPVVGKVLGKNGVWAKLPNLPRHVHGEYN